MGQKNVVFGSYEYQFRVRNISISGQRGGRQYPPKTGQTLELSDTNIQHQNPVVKSFR